MEYHGTRLPARARSAEPSWPAVIATTVRLWLERHPFPGRKRPRGRRVAAAVAAAGAVALAAGAAGAVVGHADATPAAGARPPAGALSASAATREAAARWTAAQVAPGAVVACDPAMCAALQADGIAAARLLVLGSAAADPLGSDLVIATSAVRGEFGARLQRVYAPAVIASFGSGPGRIDVRATAPDGAAAYESALAADRVSRASAGAQLLRNPRVSVAPAARAALGNGDVDPRLLMMLAALAVQQPVRVSAFGDPSPGAGQAVPLRSARVSPLPAGGAALRSMLSFVNAQRQPFLPLRSTVAGSAALTIEYAAPSPLGLISGP